MVNGNSSYFKLICILFLTVFLVGLVSAQQTENIRFYAEQNTALDLFEKCTVNGFACGASFICNITTIRSQTQETIVLNQQMTKDQTIYNFTLNDTQNSQLGLYEDTVYCDNSSDSGSSTFFHLITPSGAPPIESGEGFTLLGLILVLILSIIFFLFMGILSRNVPFSIFFVALSILLLVFTIGFGVTIMEQLFGIFSQLVAGYGIVYRLMIILLGGGMVGLMLYLVVVSLRALQIKRGLRDAQ